MKFGIAIPSSHQGTFLPTPFAGPDDIVRIVQLAERLGFHSAWGIDYMTLQDATIPPRSTWPEWHELLTTLAFVAARTSTIQIGAGALQLPLRDPFTVARQAATIDVLSKGRMLLGVGLGSKRVQFERMRPRDIKANRSRMFDEYLEVMHRFFTEDAVSYDGRYYACKDLCLVPAPVQKPFPLYLSGSTDDIFERIAKWGTGVLLARRHVQAAHFGSYIDQLDQHLARVGRHHDEIDLVVTNGLSLARTKEAAFDRFYNSLLPSSMDGIASKQGMGGRTSQDLSQVLLYNLIGTPDDVIEQTHTIAQRKITHCVLYYNPVRDVQEMADQIQWFGELVLPAFRAA